MEIVTVDLNSSMAVYSVFWDCPNNTRLHPSSHSMCSPPPSRDRGGRKGFFLKEKRNHHSLPEVARTTVPQNVHRISRKWGHSVSSLAHNIRSSNPNVLSRALIIICNCSMKKTILLQWNTLLTSGWAGITNLFPGDQLKWTITIFSFLNNSLKERMKKTKTRRSEKNKHYFNWESE